MASDFKSAFGYRLTQKAEMDLNEIVDYICNELSNQKATSDFLDKFESVIAEARSFPESGSPITNEFIPNANIRTKKLGNYIMYYLPDYSENTIFILRIIYGRRNIDEILRELDI